jgi:hypothetical protein
MFLPRHGRAVALSEGNQTFPGSQGTIVNGYETLDWQKPASVFMRSSFPQNLKALR